MENPSHSLNDRNGNALSIAPDPVMNVLQNIRVNRCNVTKESQTLNSRANLAELTKEFHDLTCKMKHLKEVLKNPSTASGKKSYPTVTNSSCQALEIKNFQDICAVKRFIRECILNLTLIDHFLDGNDITTEKYRKKLQNALTRERVIGNTVVIQGLSTAANTFELMLESDKKTPFSSPDMTHRNIFPCETLQTITLNVKIENPHGTNLMAQVAVGTPDDFWKQNRMEAEVQTDLISTKINETSLNKN